VILEANATLSRWLIHLWHALTETPSPLLQVVIEWIRTCEQELQDAARTSTAR